MLSIATCFRTGADLLQSAGLLFAELVQGGAIEAEYERQGVLLVYRTESAMQGYAWVNAQLEPCGAPTGLSCANQENRSGVRQGREAASGPGRWAGFSSDEVQRWGSWPDFKGMFR